MVSSTQQFERIRKRKQSTAGKRNKRERRANGTPVFPIHPVGYNASAADAKPVAKPAEAKPVAAKPAKAAKPAASKKA